MEQFSHPALNLQKSKKLIYTAFSKHYFYYRMFISRFVLEKNYVPLNPFMVFDYFLLDTVPRDLVREANNTLVQRADEIWVFGPISNGVLAEIVLAKKIGKAIIFYEIAKPHSIQLINVDEIKMEDEVQNFKSLITS